MKSKLKVIYQKETETIRQLPENYLLAHKCNRRWVCDPDLACDRAIAIKLFRMCLNYDVRYGSGQNLVNCL